MANPGNFIPPAGLSRAKLKKRLRELAADPEKRKALFNKPRRERKGLSE